MTLFHFTFLYCYKVLLPNGLVGSLFAFNRFKTMGDKHTTKQVSIKNILKPMAINEYIKYSLMMKTGEKSSETIQKNNHINTIDI
ncbi:hypothetical protein QWZ16_23010 [Vibrio ostreicida]|uniref:Uncharacterized protein n=1 Tax=Vibrio ostreicida TaxID=526588 RepID=A0ABT8C0I0_9VIBR|nr:hypothetical protein [Vibrio ostreicida]MDN3612474.1 hypothetical protein [Vibrio ostreicida]